MISRGSNLEAAYTGKNTERLAVQLLPLLMTIFTSPDYMDRGAYSYPDVVPLIIIFPNCEALEYGNAPFQPHIRPIRLRIVAFVTLEKNEEFVAQISLSRQEWTRLGITDSPKTK